MALTFTQKKYIGIAAAVVVALVLTLAYTLRSKPFKMAAMGSSGIVITADQLESVLARDGIPGIEYGDATFELPNESWFTNTFFFDYTRFMTLANKAVYRPGANDCDKFSLFFHAAANLVPRTKNSGVAIGELWFYQPAHAISVAVCIDDNGRTNVVYVEPQGPVKVTITPEQRRTANMAHF
jgi:hypothetical protein